MINGLILHPAIASPYPNVQGERSYLRARVRVAQSQSIQKEWIEETVSSLSARHSRASEVSPARSFVEAVFLAKNCRGRYKKIGGLATPPFSEWRGSQPLRWRDFTRERYRHQISRNPLLMQSSLCRQIY